MTAGIHHFLFISLFLFSAGLVAVVLKRNVVHVLMGIELILNAASLNMITFSHFTKHIDPDLALSGQIFSIFIIVLAAAEAVIALAILFCVFSAHRTPKVEELTELKG